MSDLRANVPRCAECGAEVILVREERTVRSYYTPHGFRGSVVGREAWRAFNLAGDYGCDDYFTTVQRLECERDASHACGYMLSEAGVVREVTGDERD